MWVPKIVLYVLLAASALSCVVSACLALASRFYLEPIPPNVYARPQREEERPPVDTSRVFEAERQALAQPLSGLPGPGGW